MKLTFRIKYIVNNDKIVVFVFLKKSTKVFLYLLIINKKIIINIIKNFLGKIKLVCLYICFNFSSNLYGLKDFLSYKLE